MRITNRLKKSADNDYTAVTGKRAYRLYGGSNCIVSVYTYVNNLTCQQYAYAILSQITPNNRIKVSSTCQATNCVNMVHLIAEYKPTTKDKEYIKSYAKMGVDSLANSLKIPIALLQAYLSKNP